MKDKGMDRMQTDLSSGMVSGASGLTEGFFTAFTEMHRGATHVVYKARRYGRWYALKGLREEYRGNPLYEEWLAKEYAVGVGLDHPGVVRVESLEHTAPTGRCIVMEHVEGTTLREWLQGQHTAGERRAVLEQLLDAVEHCHRHGVYHHDLKPTNIMLTDDGARVKLLDFGLADGPQYAVFKQAGGTEGFAAPEQRRGETSDHRADIYALGRLAALLLPHGHRHALRRATCADPERRQQSVAELRRALRPRLPWWPLALLAVAALVYVLLHPTDHVYSALLDSGQSVGYRVLRSFPAREVALVGAAGGTAACGDMEVPATLRHHGLCYRVVEIVDSAFYRQYSLASIRLPEGLRHIGIMAFAECSRLADTLVVPTTLRSIGAGAFNDCPRLEHVVWCADSCRLELPETIWAVFDRCNALHQVRVASNVRQLPPNLFYAAGYMHLAVIDDGLEYLDADVFANNAPLDSVSLPPSLRTIGHGTFYETNIRHLVLPDGLTDVGAFAFAYDDELRSVDMGPHVQSVGNYAFVDCASLRSVRVRAVVPPEAMDATFRGVPATAVLYVPAEAVAAYRRHPVWGAAFTDVRPLDAGPQASAEAAH